MINLYVMEGNYVNTKEELNYDNSDHGISGAYEVNMSKEEYENNKNKVNEIIKEHCFSNGKLPEGYIVIN